MTAEKLFSPCIESLTWGRVQIEGYAAPFKDVKLYPGGAREWDWRETGTRHTPGIQTADVQELLDSGAEVIVLSSGFHDRLLVQPQTLQDLKAAGVTAYTLNTEEVMRFYNEQREQRPTGALIHSTC